MMVFTQTEEYFVCASLPDYPAHLFMHPDTFNTEVDFSNCQVFVESQRGSMICMLAQYCKRRLSTVWQILIFLRG